MDTAKLCTDKDPRKKSYREINMQEEKGTDIATTKKGSKG